MKSYQNYIKESTDWNQVLHDGTWTQKKISEDRWYMDLDKIKLAIENGADPDYCETLIWATRMDNVPVVKFMLDNGSDVNNQQVTPHDSGNWAPLMLSSMDGNLEVSKILIDYGADPTLENFQGFTVFDIILPSKETEWYQNASSEEKNARDKIFQYLIQHIKKNTPIYNNIETLLKYVKDYLTEEELKVYDSFIEAEKFNF